MSFLNAIIPTQTRPSDLSEGAVRSFTAKDSIRADMGSHSWTLKNASFLKEFETEPESAAEMKQAAFTG